MMEINGANNALNQAALQNSQRINDKAAQKPQQVDQASQANKVQSVVNDQEGQQVQVGKAVDFGEPYIVNVSEEGKQLSEAEDWNPETAMVASQTAGLNGQADGKVSALSSLNAKDEEQESTLSAVQNTATNSKAGRAASAYNSFKTEESLTKSPANAAVDSNKDEEPVNTSNPEAATDSEPVNTNNLGQYTNAELKQYMLGGSITRFEYQAELDRRNNVK